MIARLELALGHVGGVRWQTSSIACTCSRSRSGSRLRASAQTRHSGGTMLPATPPSDQADVGGRLRRRCGRAACRRSRAPRPAIALRPSSGAIPECAAPAPEGELAACCWDGAASDDRCRSARRGRSSSRTRPCSRETSNALAPCRPTSSIGVSTSSTPGVRRRRAHEIARRAASITATAALLSAPRIVSSAFTTMPFRTSGSTGAVGRDGVEVGVQEDRASRRRRRPAPGGSRCCRSPSRSGRRRRPRRARGRGRAGRSSTRSATARSSPRAGWGSPPARRKSSRTRSRRAHARPLALRP